jgi:hypothetical protein
VLLGGGHLAVDFTTADLAVVDRAGAQLPATLYHQRARAKEAKYDMIALEAAHQGTDGLDCFHFVFFLVIELWMSETICKDSVIREEQETRRIFIQTTHGKDFSLELGREHITHGARARFHS